MALETNGKKGQHNSYMYFPGGKHTHTWYNPSTGQMGYHGENASAADKKTTGQGAAAHRCGSWFKGVKGPK